MSKGKRARSRATQGGAPRKVAPQKVTATAAASKASSPSASAAAPAKKATVPAKKVATPAKKAAPVMSASTYGSVRWRWDNTSKWAKAFVAFVVGLVAFIAALQALTGDIGDAVGLATKDSSAEADAKTLNSLRVGEDFSAFESTLKVSQTALLDTKIATELPEYVGSTLDDHFFILKTVYVEAFVNQSNAVRAYTITARTSDMPQGLKILGQTYNLGKTTLADAPIDRVTDVGDVCAAHIVAYWEISDTSEADLNQYVGVGLAGASNYPKGFRFPTCPFANTDDLAYDKEVPGNPGAATIPLRIATQPYMNSSQALRSQMVVTAITVSDAGPVMPQMIALHPQEIAQFDPHR